MQRPSHRLTLALSGLAFACADGPLNADGTPARRSASLACGESATGLEIHPMRSEVEAGSARGGTIFFRAVAERESGGRVGAPAIWSVDPPEIGAIDAGGRFVPSGVLGGDAVVFARAGGHLAEAHVGVRHVARVVDPEFSPAALARLADDRPRTAEGGPALEAPIDGAVLTAEAAVVEFRWEARRNVAFRLRLQSAVSDVSVFTHAARHMPSDELWRALVRSNAGGLVRVTIEGVTPDGPVRRSSATVAVRLCGAPERCNGLDEDCNGAIDDGCAPPVVPEDLDACE